MNTSSACFCTGGPNCCLNKPGALPGLRSSIYQQYPDAWGEILTPEQQKRRDAENVAKLQALMQHESVFDKQTDEPAKLTAEQIHVRWQEPNGYKGQTTKAFPSRLVADTFARQLIDNGIASYTDVITIHTTHEATK